MIVAWDLMQTLVTDPFREAHEAGTGLSWEQFESRRPNGSYHRLERGEIIEEQYWADLRAHGVDVDVDRFHATRRDGYRWLPGMRKLLRECATAVITVVASNYPDWIADVFPDEFARLGVRCHASWQFGCRKPDPEFFAALAAAEGVPVNELALVDDREENVAELRRLGGRGIHMDSAAGVAAQLRAFGVLTADRIEVGW